jgi:hypothetical protein
VAGALFDGGNCVPQVEQMKAGMSDRLHQPSRGRPATMNVLPSGASKQGTED